LWGDGERNMADSISRRDAKVGAIMLGLALVAEAGINIGESKGISVPEDFKKAASIGQVSQVQTVKTCTTVQTKLNEALRQGQQDNSPVPRQTIDLHCEQATIITVPAAWIPATR
jgi:hypothetical protein